MKSRIKISITFLILIISTTSISQCTGFEELLFESDCFYIDISDSPSDYYDVTFKTVYCDNTEIETEKTRYYSTTTLQINYEDIPNNETASYWWVNVYYQSGFMTYTIQRSDLPSEFSESPCDTTNGETNNGGGNGNNLGLILGITIPVGVLGIVFIKSRTYKKKSSVLKEYHEFISKSKKNKHSFKLFTKWVKTKHPEYDAPMRSKLYQDYQKRYGK